MTLFPVVMPVHLPTKGNHDFPDPSYLKRGSLSGREKVDHLSRAAREALKLSAGKSAVKLGKLMQDEKGVPLPVHGIYWSISHKPKYVAAVVSTARIGIDIEEIVPRTESLFNYAVSDEEWKLRDRSWDTFFRYWTAKEAVLKAIGLGVVGGLRTCRVTSVPDENLITLDYKGETFVVEQLRYNNHIISVIKDDNQVEWIVTDKV